MPDEFTNGDALRLFHTGASTNNGAQSDPNLCFGNFCAADEVSVLNPTPQLIDSGKLSIVRVDGANGVGNGSLTIVDANNIHWTSVGGSAGADVTIPNGTTKVLEDGGDPAKFIRVQRLSATGLVAGSTAVALADVGNNVFGFDNVLAPESLSGDTEYRAFGIRNVSAFSVASLKVWILSLFNTLTSDSAQLGSSGAGTITTTGTFATWPTTGFAQIRNSAGALREIVYYNAKSGTTQLLVPSAGRGLQGTAAAAGVNTDTIDCVSPLALAKYEPNAQPNGYITSVADENTAPVAATWNTGLTSATGLDFGTVPAGHWKGVFMRRQIPAGFLQATNIKMYLGFSYQT